MTTWMFWSTVVEERRTYGLRAFPGRRLDEGMKRPALGGSPGPWALCRLERGVIHSPFSPSCSSSSTAAGSGFSEPASETELA